VRGVLHASIRPDAAHVREELGYLLEVLSRG
jgi:hypothetical protein